jgi:hypothetical protein
LKKIFNIVRIAIGIVIIVALFYYVVVLHFGR